MKQLELKHIAPYFPYGLEVQYIGDMTDDNKRVDGDYIKIGEIAKIGSVDFRYSNPVYWMDFERGLFGVNSNVFKPILRPLSDLTKEIEYNGEKFIPCEQFSYDMECMLRLGDVDTGCQPYSLIQKLIEWNFDIFGLIDKDLAIDINARGLCFR